jgi:RNA polymerase sigma-70 factor (ECF subfamily)
MSISPSDFARHLAERIPPDKEAVGALDASHTDDIYLTFGCSRGDAAALNLFEKRLLSRVPSFLRRIDPAGTLFDEVRQGLRAELLVGAPGKPPRIATYQGRGSLGGWLRVAAVRMAVRLRRSERNDSPIESGEPWMAGPDPELDYIKAGYRGAFGDAFRASFASLSKEHREVLRLYLVEGLNIDEIGRRYGVHRATVARWLARARELLLTETRRVLQERIRASSSELNSLIGLLQSQLDVSIHRYLSRE